MINIKIKLEATSSISKHLTVEELTLDNNVQISIAAIIELLEIPMSEIGFATISGKKVGFDDLVQDGDLVKFYTKIITG